MSVLIHHNGVFNSYDTWTKLTLLSKGVKMETLRNITELTIPLTADRIRRTIANGTSVHHSDLRHTVENNAEGLSLENFIKKYLTASNLIETLEPIAPVTNIEIPRGQRSNPTRYSGCDFF